MEVNPYQSASSRIAESQLVVPHTKSVRSEAWRGFKFGARITCIVMSGIVALIGLILLGMAIYAVVVTRGGILNAISYFEIARGIGGSIFAVLLMSFYGGIVGGVIMMLVAFVRKRRGSNADSKQA